MRITNTMMGDQLLFNMQRSIGRFLEVQTQLSSGRRLNKPSDDPVGVQRDLIYRTEIAKTTQYRKNIHQAQAWMNSYDNILDDLGNHMSSAKELAIAMANGTYDEAARVGAATEVESIFDRLVQLANNELEGKYTFSGFRTYDKAVTPATAGIVYNGDQGQMEYQIETSSRLVVNLSGSEVFLKQLLTLGETADLNVGVTGATLLADLHNGAAISQTPGTFTITDENLGISSTIDVSTATTIQDVLDSINAQLAADGINNVQAVIGGEGNNILLDTTPNGLISDSTAIRNLHSGGGIDMESGRLLVTDGAGINVSIDIAGAATIGDLRSAFNTQMAAAGYPLVTMSVNAAGTGLQIDDASGVLGLRVEDISSETSTAFDLGIVGDINPTLVGTGLEPMVSIKVEETTGTTAADLGILGSFTGDYSGSDLDPHLTATSALANLNNSLGLQLGRIVIHQGNTSRTIDLSDMSLVTVQDVIDKLNNSGLDITASINPDARGIQIVNNDTTKSFIIEEEEVTGTTARDLRLWGSSDLMGSTLLLGNALRNNDQEGTGLLLDQMDKAIDHLLNYRAAVGSKSIRLESTLSRIDELELSFVKLLSDVEDADITRLATELAIRENNYKASLMAAARIVQPSLLDFLG